MTVHELLETMPNREFAYWVVYHGRRAQEQEIASQK